MPPETRSSRAGYLAAIGAYLSWGALPPYLLLLAPTGPFEIVVFRILASLAFCAVLLTALRGWRRLLGLLRDGRLLALTAVAAVVIYLNWQIYVIAAVSGHVLEASLGYFVNPILTVLLGVLVLREKVRPLQWVALGIAAVAILVLAIGYGSVPWIALALATSFGIYGLVKRVIGPRVDAVSGLTVETAWLTPVALVQLALVAAVGGGITFGTAGAGHVVLLLGLGIMTTVPLLLFAAGARRIPLVALGLTQFLTPILQFLYGLLALHEAMPPERWAGFGLVWVALAVLVADMVVSSRPPRRAFVERV